MKRESELECYLKLRVEQEGGICLKVKFLARKGAPDRLVLLPRKHFLVELKCRGKKAEAHQARLHVILRKSGFKVFVISEFSQVDEVLK